MSEIVAFVAVWDETVSVEVAPGEDDPNAPFEPDEEEEGEGE